MAWCSPRTTSPAGETPPHHRQDRGWAAASAGRSATIRAAAPAPETRGADDNEGGRARRVQHARRPDAGLLLDLALWSAAAAASASEPTWDLPTHLVDEPPGLAQLCAQYAPMTEAQLVAAGFQVDPMYVTAEMVGLPAAAGAMGYHAIHPGLMGAQFPQGVMDPQRPPVVLLGPDKRVIGVEWEAANRGQAPPQLYGQTANPGSAHPGVDQSHYMPHAFFRPGGKILFGDFDPALAAPGLPNTGAGGGQGTRLSTSPLAALALIVVCPLLAAAVRGRAARRLTVVPRATTWPACRPRAAPR